MFFFHNSEAIFIQDGLCGFLKQFLGYNFTKMGKYVFFLPSSAPHSQMFSDSMNIKQAAASKSVLEGVLPVRVVAISKGPNAKE